MVRLSKIRAPHVRNKVLSRPRLIDWLNAHVSHRVVTVVAGAGSGKTTLLADFSDRTRLRTLWYRLDATDRSFRAFVERFVLSGQQLDAQFAPLTRGLLAETGPTPASPDEVAATFLSELASLAGGTGIAIIFDDYHEVDDVPEIQSLIVELLTHGPDRLTVMIAARRQPAVPMARLKLLGEVAELSAIDLRFDTSETEGLFRDIYGRPLGKETAEELALRTEGWAASLHLVAAAIKAKSDRDGREFIHSLTGCDRHLHDYLAEEVMGSLPENLKRLLMRASLLEDFDLGLCAAVVERPVTEMRHHLDQALRSGLLERSGDGRGYYRFHPLVREFLSERLRRDVSADEIRRLHLVIAHQAGVADWERALHHFVQADQRDRALATLTAALTRILAHGRYDDAAALCARLGLEDALPPLLVLRSRSEFRAGRSMRALELARSAVDREPSNPSALMNLMSLAFTAGDLDGARDAGDRLGKLDLDHDVARIAHLQEQLLAASLDFDLGVFVENFNRAAATNRADGHRHYEGICLVNVGVALRSMGRAQEALESANQALIALQASSMGPERASARMVRAWALAYQGEMAAARAEASVANFEGGAASQTEIALELADLEIWFGSEAEAVGALASVPLAAALDADQAEQKLLCSLGLALRRGDSTSFGAVAQLRFGEPSTASAMQARRMAIRAHVACATGDPDADSLVELALAHAQAQQADFWTGYLLALRAVLGPAERARAALRSLTVPPAYLSVHAEALVRRLPDLLDESDSHLVQVVERQPARWREVLRPLVTNPAAWKRSRSWAASALDIIGDKSDVALLRRAAKTLPAPAGRPPLGKGLARRLAEPVQIHDLNRVVLSIGDHSISGADIRRKALGLLCFLVTKPGFSATRDEVMDALWPDTDPAYAINSLNQTAYFLRRALEPDFAEEHSPGYLRYQADLVWLDADLVASDAAHLMQLLEKAGREPRPELISEISASYTGKFALDFTYDDWSSDFREHLHASYLAVMEAEIRRELELGRTGRGIELARRVLGVDGEASEIELLLVRLYAVGGSHAAAAEQYAHYSGVMREDLGVEVPPLDSL